MDGELVCRVLQLMNLTDQRLSQVIIFKKNLKFFVKKYVANNLYTVLPICVSRKLFLTLNVDKDSKKILLLSLEGFSLMKMSNMIGGYLCGEYLVVP